VSSRHVRVYGLLLRLYPRRFRAAYRHEMQLLFAQQLEDARASGGSAGVLRLWIRSLFDLVATAPSEHLVREALVAQPVVGRDEVGRQDRRAERISWAVAALAPGAFAVLLLTAAPRGIGPMFAKPPEAFGLPLGVVIAAGCAAWYALGVGLIALASRPLGRLAALVVFILPATFFAVMGPAIIFILQNLAAGSD
jgi:hypothetical protein